MEDTNCKGERGGINKFIADSSGYHGYTVNEIKALEWTTLCVLCMDI